MLNLRGSEGEDLGAGLRTRNCHGRGPDWKIAGSTPGPYHPRQKARTVTTPQSAWNAIMQYSFLRVFADDGTISADELAMFQRLALQDGEVDEKERSVLSRIFARVNEHSVVPEVWQDIVRFKAEHQIP